MKSVTLLGATGSIGVSTLDVIAQHPERFSVFALSACRNVERLFQQCQTFKPRYAVLTEPQAAEQLYALLQQVDLPTQVLVGEDALCQIASDPEVDYVMAAIVGAAGLKPALAAAQAGKRVLLANKEALVMSGQLFMDAIQASGAELLPIDSEHNAIFQCLPTQNRQQGVQKLVLTASGGPFRTWAKERLINVTPAQAVAHPNWSMGQKISVDSATLMNKGLETIEACWLFNVSMEQIEVVVHPQSTIHSMVTYCDGSVLAQLGNPDMRTPIAYALGYPERLLSGVKPLDFIQLARLDFERPDTERFPCLRLASEAHQAGGYATIALNAANEEAVQAFLKQQIGFMDIPRLIEQVVVQARAGTPTTLETIFIQDKDSREAALSWIKTKKMQ
ncbi:MAG: 1-deoxy-D-xylulose-5-phosphate reductoisomerase [Thiofilum sp.]|uniref:1-deoxy-D-xylulose-5-phosphate reductoisomerase n=1 Tax=Thiofilum sp. TaxID=2212733 RepID=UPI0025F6F6E1|nr:1-deoxy-D-xylulose-5-phosphate reductoisomerase [Thiofilum sp.]MBK8453588.1 1-deoxy-D-xylulose-5-phosphate reductoisomerase [Thiofilum sp.]